jgi:virginiamycin B lyase
VGPDGNIWFGESVRTPASAYIGKMSQAGVLLAEYQLSFNDSSLILEIPSIVPGPDGKLWFTEQVEQVDSTTPTVNYIGRISTTGTITEFPVCSPDAELHDITAGPDGNLWFAENGTNLIGRITTKGAITEYSGLTGFDVTGITAGPADSKTLWFTEAETNSSGTPAGGKIGRIQLPAPSTPAACFTPAEPSPSPSPSPAPTPTPTAVAVLANTGAGSGPAAGLLLLVAGAVLVVSAPLILLRRRRHRRV